MYFIEQLTFIQNIILGNRANHQLFAQLFFIKLKLNCQCINVEFYISFIADRTSIQV